MPNKKGGKKYKKNKKDTTTIKVLIKRTTDTELYGRVTKICGNGRFTILCTDGIERLGIIRGKLRKRMWIVMNNIVFSRRPDEVGGCAWLKLDPHEFMKYKPCIEREVLDNERGHRRSLPRHMIIGPLPQPVVKLHLARRWASKG